MKHGCALIAITFLVGCDSPPQENNILFEDSSENAGAALNQKAVATGILPDPNNIVVAGRYETRSELGTDKFCAVKTGKDVYDIGVLAVFGPESKCEGRGRAKISGEKVEISLSGKKNCRFDAEFDGIELRFPGAMEEGCSAYCSPRASFSGTSYFMVEEGDQNARRALGRDFDRLCP